MFIKCRPSSTDAIGSPLMGLFALPLAEGKRRKCPNKLRHFINTFSYDSKLSTLRLFNEYQAKPVNERL